jgi:hypothetical protein
MSENPFDHPTGNVEKPALEPAAFVDEQGQQVTPPQRPFKDGQVIYRWVEPCIIHLSDPFELPYNFVPEQTKTSRDGELFTIPPTHRFKVAVEMTGENRGFSLVHQFIDLVTVEDQPEEWTTDKKLQFKPAATLKDAKRVGHMLYGLCTQFGMETPSLDTPYAELGELWNQVIQEGVQTNAVIQHVRYKNRDGDRATSQKLVGFQA